MTRDRAPIFVAFTDLLICLLCYVLIAVTPTKAKIDGVKPPVLFLVSITWDVTLDSDIDLWYVGPSRKPVFYGSRQQGCADLDHDDVGFATSHITLADGSVVSAVAHKEVLSVRCVEPGRTDIAVNEFSDRTGQPITVHVEITGMNPQVQTLFSGDVVLNHRGDTRNVASFDLDHDGKLTLADAPLESVLDAYEHTKAGSAP